MAWYSRLPWQARRKPVEACPTRPLSALSGAACAGVPPGGRSQPGPFHQRNGERLVVLVVVNPHDDAGVLVDLALVGIGGVGDLLLEKALGDGRQDPPGSLDALEDRAVPAPPAGWSAPRQRRAAERVDRVGRAGFGGNDLLGAQGDRGGLLGGTARASSIELVCRRLGPAQDSGQRLDRHPHRVISGCWAVRVMPAVWVWKRSSQERGSLAWKVSRISRAQMRRAARYLAISSKKSMWALKKNESRGANSSTSMPRAIPQRTYSIPSEG